MRKTIISVVEQIAQALEYEFKPFVPELMPSMLKVFVQDDSDGKQVTLTVSAS
jgi:FKBP12-rapamycin complex-associated protein